MSFLPITKEEMNARNIQRPDFVYISGDAYVDHSSFGSAIITRLLESRGYSVGMIAQPDWRNPESIAVFGEPRLAFIVSSGNMDSMVNHYTVNKKRRKRDAYSPGGRIGLRPDRAVVVYGNLIRRLYKHTPIILGGIEASLRRLGHYDYWADQVKRSILLDSGADIISYGMGEHSILELAEALDGGIPVSQITYVAGTVYKTARLKEQDHTIELPSFEKIAGDKAEYARSFFLQYQNTDPYTAKPLAEYYGSRGYVVQNPPAKPLTTMEMDDIYGLPYMGKAHPVYDKMGGIPALSEVKFSLTSNRGCFGGCNFCALTFHQGRIVQVRSQESLLKEAKAFTEDSEFKGYIHDVGGPTADFRHTACEKQERKGSCKDRQCLFPEPCRNLDPDHSDYIELLRKLRALPKVKKVFVRSGIRFDYVLAEKKDDFLKELVRHHISGQLRVAPEHVSDPVLTCMGKPKHSVYQKFLEKFQMYNEKYGMQQYAVPYFMSSHPGCRLKDAVRLAEYVRDLGYMPEQVQDFYPTPSTISTCMYYTGLDPRTMQPVYVPKSAHEKAMQRALLQYRLPENRALVLEALKKTGRQDLIGYDKKCLIRPEQGKKEPERNRTMAKDRKKKTIRNVHKKKTGR
ncbi:MAG: YgiQ family radical SAM protein [Ruminococcus sp.]|jgi:uncharacterized radical SAM protein YgiQ